MSSGKWRPFCLGLNLLKILSLLVEKHTRYFYRCCWCYNYYYYYYYCFCYYHCYYHYHYHHIIIYYHYHLLSLSFIIFYHIIIIIVIDIVIVIIFIIIIIIIITIIIIVIIIIIIIIFVIIIIITIITAIYSEMVAISLEWRHNQRHGVSNHRRLGYLFKRLFRHKSKKTSKLRVTDTGDRWNPPHKGPVTRKMFPFDGVIWWRHVWPGLHVLRWILTLFSIHSICQKKQAGTIQRKYGRHDCRGIIGESSVGEHVDSTTCNIY